MNAIAKLGHILREWWSSANIIKSGVKTIFESPLIKAYLDRMFQIDKEADARVEKILATVVVKYSMNNLNMSKEEALQAAREAVAFLRDYRATKLFEEGKITESGRELYKRFIHSAWVKAAVKTELKRHKESVKTILNKLVKKVPYLGTILEIVNSVIPEDTKNKIKETAKKMCNEAIEKLPDAIEMVTERVYKAAKKVKETIQKVKEVVATGAAKLKEKVNNYADNHPWAKNAIEIGKAIVKNSPIGDLIERGRRIRDILFA